jgi:hypothetical protein
VPETPKPITITSLYRDGQRILPVTGNGGIKLDVGYATIMLNCNKVVYTTASNHPSIEYTDEGMFAVYRCGSGV